MLLEKMYELKEGNDSKLWKDCIDILIRDCEGMNDQDIIRHLWEIERYGCESGIVGYLIPTANCKDFLVRNLEEILDLYNETRAESSGIPNELDCTFLAWFGFEQTASQLLYELEDYMQEQQV